ncbi:MAG: gliding motility-associated C-terminal domain-containing protein [Bacteroidia bacterium]
MPVGFRFINMKRSYVILIFLFVNCIICNSQVNLVLNPSFEILDSCPNSGLQINRATNWNNINNTWPCQGQLAHHCCVDPQCTTPSNQNGGGTTYQFPRTGDGYCALSIYSPPIPAFFDNFRVYTIGKLSTTLMNGKEYCGKFYVNLDNTSAYKCNRLGMYFDNGSLIGAQVSCNSNLSVISHIDNNPSFILDDTLNWMKIEGTYIANGTENKVTIGNFYNTAQTVGLVTGFITPLGVAYYNIDDISLIPFEIKAFAGNDVTICLGDSVELGRPQEVGLDCWWYNLGNSNSFSSKSNFNFKPTQTGVFSFIQKMDNCQISYDTVNVTVIQDCNQLPVVEPIINIPNTFSPNGDGINDVWYVDLKNNVNVSYTIYNRWGTVIKQNEINTQTFVQWDGRTTSGEQVSVGVYYYVLEYVDKKGDKIKKQGYISLFK